MKTLTNQASNTSHITTTVDAILLAQQILAANLTNQDRVISNGGVNLTPFTAISGNNVYGTEVLILDTGDTPIQPGMVYYNFAKIQVTRVQHITPYRMQVAYGTGTFAAAVAALQYSELIYKVDDIVYSSYSTEFRTPRLAAGTKLWWRIWNATNLSEVDAFFSLAEYPL